MPKHTAPSVWIWVDGKATLKINGTTVAEIDSDGNLKIKGSLGTRKSL